MAVQRASKDRPGETGTPGEFVFAHLSDPHLTGLADVRALDLLNKRILGYKSWRRRRRHEHRREVLDALLEDLRRIGPEHTVITGDMTHLGLPEEFREVAAWLPRVGQPGEVTIVPGNHDAYVNEPWKDTLALWAPYMASDHGAGRDGRLAAFFPSLRVRGPTALIGANSARPSAPFLAVGSVGRSQLQALASTLRETGERGFCRVLLIHHPPVPGSIRWRKRLTDADQLARVIEQQGVELVLHGHGHHSCLHWFATPAGRAPVLGVRSASAIGVRSGLPAQYHVLRIVAARPGWHLTLEVRQYDPVQRGFVRTDTWRHPLGQIG